MSVFVGCRKLEVTDQKDGISFPMLIMYPTDAPAQIVSFGPFQMNLAMGAAIQDGKFPLIMISHGSGGSYLTHRTLATHLAAHGFVVCVPEHPFNNRHNNERQYTLDNLIDRPRHTSLAIDVLIQHEHFRDHLKEDQVAVIGHSTGGYTALALAGGKPHTQFLLDFCQDTTVKKKPDWCGLILKNGLTSQVIEVKADKRVKAIILLSPDTSLFMNEGGLNKVDTPIMLWVAENDFAPEQTIQGMIKGLPDKDKLNYRTVENASHYAFLSPFPPAIIHRVGAASLDPPGFDRELFHQELNAEVLAFLQNNLPLSASG